MEKKVRSNGRFVWMLCLGLLAVFFAAACGKADGEETPVKTLEEIYTRMCEEAALPEMIRLEDEYITNFYGVDLSTLDEYVFAVAEDALLAETVILVKMKEGESTEAVVRLMENMIRDKKAQLADYLPEQYKIVEKSAVVTKGDYAYLIISSEQDALKKIAADEIR